VKVTVRYTAQAREAVGASSEVLELDSPTTVHDLVVRLARQHGSAFRRLALDEKGCPHAALLVVVGDEQVRSTDPRHLSDGETVTIMSPVSGG
jgi:MoaD family protein